MIDDLRPLFSKFMVFAKDRMQFKNPPRLFLKKDTKNSNCMLGKTAHYDPSNSGITLYISGRHPKDILRSLAHELVHHCQNERGDLAPEKMKTMNKNYAQENEHMRKMEEEAYLQGNMCFRDWEDSLDDKLKYKMHIAEHKFLKENKKMSVKITKEFLKKTIERLLNERVKPLEEQRKEYNNVLRFTHTQLKQVIKAYEEGGSTGMRKKAEEISRSESDRQNGNPSDIKKNARKLVAKAKKDHAEKYKEAVAAFRNKGKDSDTAVAEEPKDVPQKVKESKNEQEQLSEGPTGAYCRLPGGKDGMYVPTTKEEEAKTGKKSKCVSYEQAMTLSKTGELDEDAKTNTPEQENKLYESRFTNRNSKLFEKLLKEWTK